jgi:hypothetical protein
MIRRPQTILLLALAAFSLTACEAPTESTELEVELSADPNPAPAEPSSGVTYTIEGDENEEDQIVEYPWRTSFVVTIAEVGGVALDVTGVSVGVQQATGGIVIAPSGGKIERYQFNSSAGGNHVSAYSSISMGFEVWYDLPNDGREALITVNLTFRDEDEYSYADSVEVRVAP